MAHDGPQFLSESLASIDGHAELRGWRRGDTPSVYVNASREPVKAWTTLPPRQFFMHPGPQGAVAIAWLSPVDGAIAIRGRVSDAHVGGDGVGWQITHFADAGLADAFVELGATTRQLAAAQQSRDALVERDRQIPRAYAVCEGEPHNAHIQMRGEPKDLGDEVPRKFPDFLGGQQVTQGSGRRELAGWLTDPANPLTARVMVNRLWQWHFGRGLVKTPNDFGTRGAPPTHPELLDYLAGKFLKSGWSVRAIDRLIVTSAAYRQAAVGAADDSYVGFARRRLTAEELRDTLLAATGELDSAGRSASLPARVKLVVHATRPLCRRIRHAQAERIRDAKAESPRRFFALFDGADPNASTPVRDVTTVPTQALFFLNDPFLHERAAKFATRVVAAADDDARGWISPIGNFSAACRSPTSAPSRWSFYTVSRLRPKSRPTSRPANQGLKSTPPGPLFRESSSPATSSSTSTEPGVAR